MLTVCFIHTLIYSALNLSMKFRNIPEDPQVIFLWLHVANN